MNHSGFNSVLPLERIVLIVGVSLQRRLSMAFGVQQPTDEHVLT